MVTVNGSIRIAIKIVAVRKTLRHFMVVRSDFQVLHPRLNLLFFKGIHPIIPELIVVNHLELTLDGVFAVHAEPTLARIAIRLGQLAKNLIVSTILFCDIDNVFDG